MLEKRLITKPARRLADAADACVDGIGAEVGDRRDFVDAELFKEA